MSVEIQLPPLPEPDRAGMYYPQAMIQYGRDCATLAATLMRQQCKSAVDELIEIARGQ